MIAFLKGAVKKKLTRSIILDTGDIGYEVYISQPLHEKIGEDDATELFIHTRVREDDISLYGFETFGEIEFFKTLLSINGIGAKLALEILSKNPENVKAAILEKDIAYLNKIPGIGKKTAERIIVELKNKIDWKDVARAPGGLRTEVNDDAVEAIMNLGYQKFEINKVLKDLPKEIEQAEEIITYFLRNV